MAGLVDAVRRSREPIATELLNRSTPYHGRAKNLMPEWSTKQLDLMAQEYDDFIKTIEDYLQGQLPRPVPGMPEA